MSPDGRGRISRLQQKFFIALLIVGILPGVAALVATYLTSIDSLKHSIGSGFQEIARSTAIRIAAAVDSEIDRAERLAAVPMAVRDIVEAANRRYTGRRESEDAIRAPTSPVITTYLQEWTRDALSYVRVVIADRRGLVVASTDPAIAGSVADAEWWREPIRLPAGSAYVSTLHRDDAGQDYVFDVAVPIVGRTHETIGVVALAIRRDVLMNTVLPIRVGETGHGMLLDTLGTPLICPVLPPTAHLIHEALLSQVVQDRPLWLVADDDAHGGHDSIVGAAPVRFLHPLSPLSLGGTRWFAFVRQPPAETYAPIYSLLVTVGLIGFGLVVVLASLGFVVGRRIVSPILALRREADELRRDVADLPAMSISTACDRPAAPVAIRTGDEIEDLATTFYGMRRALEESLRTVKTQQEELIRREKLASVGQLLAALAHDIRNPLGVIRSSAQLVLDAQQPDPVKQEVARYIIEEVDRLAHRINDFLRYARQKPPEPRRTRPEMLVEAALAQWRAQGGPAGITVDTQYDAACSAVSVDPEQVKEALVNLLVNAREAMPQGGRITAISRQAGAGQIELEIADTGCGIPPASLERIFEPFFTTKDYGTGLGLTNVKRLIQDNGGSLSVQSEPGIGTRFVLRFPTAETTAAPAQNRSTAAERVRSG